jgi:hypothetical protein
VSEGGSVFVWVVREKKAWGEGVHVLRAARAHASRPRRPRSAGRSRYRSRARWPASAWRLWGRGVSLFTAWEFAGSC